MTREPLHLDDGGDADMVTLESVLFYVVHAGRHWRLTAKSIDL